MEYKPQNVICQNCNQDFTIDKEDFKFYEKIKVPPPTFCPECRFVRRMIWRNERSLYKRECDLCNKKVISVFDKDVAFPVYCPECWRSDAWDPMTFAQEYDSSKTFFEQWRELFLKVPRQSVWQLGDCVNTEYTNFVQGVKNVYLAYSVIKGSEDIFYSSNVDNSKIIVDSYSTVDSELIYEGISNTKNYNCQYAYWSSGCIDCNFILDCSNCQNCFGCVNLRNKSYCIWNEQYTKEEYEEKIKSLELGKYSSVTRIFDDFWDFSLKFPKKYARIINCVNSNGDELRNCKNTFFSFNSYSMEDCKYAYRSLTSKNAMDVCHMNAELAYEHMSGGSDNSQNIKFVLNGAPALSESEFCDLCQSSSNIFGCIGLKSKQYCILNKQYTKEEYEQLVLKIIKHMNDMPYVDSKGRLYKYGEFFPMEFCPFGYNESIVFDYYPLSKEEVLEKGYNWKDKEENKYTITKKPEEIPDDIKNVDDSILNETLECVITKKAYKITPFELKFYRRMNIPIPRIHHDERFKLRLALKNPMKFWHRTCMKEGCNNEFETSYAPERSEIIYCEDCYNKEVY